MWKRGIFEYGGLTLIMEAKLWSRAIWQAYASYVSFWDHHSGGIRLIGACMEVG